MTTDPEAQEPEHALLAALAQPDNNRTWFDKGWHAGWEASERTRLKQTPLTRDAAYLAEVGR